LSPYLFSLYIDDVIKDLRKSGYGIYVVNILTGCILYADDIPLLSCSYYGMQKMVNICTAYGIQCMGYQVQLYEESVHHFGGSRSSDFTVLLTGSTVWVDKIKYLGCYFNQDCTIDYSMGIQKFYGNLNNILSVLGRNRNEISTVHLVNSYCIPSLLYGCEIWSLNSSDYLKLNVTWNNTFRKIFQCCWRESVSCLFYYFSTFLPLSYILLTKEKFFLSRKCGIVTTL